jgi:nucleoside-diphosphate-sugar epimerase
VTRPSRDLGRVLVTGALGFLGAALVKSLRKDGVEVVATDAVASGGFCLCCDVTELDQVQERVRVARIDTIIHSGAVSGPMVRTDEPRTVWRINVEGTVNILEAARLHRVGRVVVCSTTEVYGDRAGRVDETTSPEPTSVYAASKLAAEHATLAWAGQHGVDALALRLSWIYGPGRRMPTMLETLLQNALRGRKTVIDGHPSDPTHYIHVDDAVNALTAAAAATANACGHRVYNATGGAGLQLGRVVEIVRRILPATQVAYRNTNPRATGPGEIVTDRISADLGFAPYVDLEAGIAGYIEALDTAAGP